MKTKFDPRIKKLARYRRKVAKRPNNVDGWAELLERIYGNNHCRQSISDIALHFLEEVGEVTRALRRLSEYPERKEHGQINVYPSEELDELQVNFYEEIADTLSWIFSLVSKISKEVLSSALMIKELYPLLNDELSDFDSHGINLPHILWTTYKHKEIDFICCPLCGKRPCACDI